MFWAQIGWSNSLECINRRIMAEVLELSDKCKIHCSVSNLFMWRCALGQGITSMLIQMGS